MHKILIYIANGLGNSILAIPALQSLKFLGYSVELAIPKDWTRSKPLLELFGAQTFIDRIIHDTSEIIPKNYYKIFISDTYEKTKMRVYLEGLYNSVVIRHPSWRGSLVHESDFIMSIPRSLGYLGPKPQTLLSTIKPTSIPPGPYIAIAFSCLEGHPWSLKRWPTSYWCDLVSMLLKTLTDCNIVLIGAKGDRDLGDEIIRFANSSKVLNACGHYTILESAYVLSRAKCLVTIDNGISHLAAASGCSNIVALYGPTLLSKNIPLGKLVNVIRVNLHCSPCFNTSAFEQCTSNICMKSIKPNAVAKLVSTKVNNKEYL